MRYRIICLALASLVLVALFYTSALEAQEQQYVFVKDWDLEPGSGAFVSDQRGPYGIALDGSDNVYVTDRYDRCFIFIPALAPSCSNIWRVEKFTPDGNFSSEFDWVWEQEVYDVEYASTPHPTGMAVDRSGYIYVADPFNESIKKFSSKGGFLREWGSPGNGNGQFYGLQDLAVDSQGYVYATDTFNSRIQKFNSDGVFLAKWTSSRLYMPLGIAVDRSGNVYVTEGEVNRVLKFSSNGALLAEWGSGVGLYSPFGIAVDNQGNVYVADTYNNRIVKFSPNGALLANWGREGDDRGEFVNPEGIAVDSQGYVYVADTGNLRIQKFMPEAPLRDTITLTSGILNETEINPSDPTIVVPEGARISGFLNITVQNGQIADVLFPVGATPTWGDREDSYWRIVRHSNPGSKKYTVEIDLEAPTAGTHYIIMACAAQPEVGYIMSCTDSGFGREDWYDDNDVVDWSASKIQSAIKNGYVNVPWLVKGGRYMSRDTGAAAVKVSVQSVKFLNKPTGVAAVPAYAGLGGYVVADTDNHRIRKFAPNGEPVNTWGSQGDGDGQFRFPSDVAVDKSGNIYVVDKDNHRVQRFSSEGIYLWKWGTQGSGNAQFNFPRGIAVDDQGNVYVADSENYRVQKFSLNGNLMAKWGSRGNQPGQFQLPCGIAVDNSRNVYVADTDNNRIQKFNSDGKFLTAWGSAGYGDLQFNRPRGVDVDQQGNIYVADTLNHRIQAFTQEGVLFYKQGVRGNGNGQFNSPYGIAVDEVSDTSVAVYVADTNNDRIQDFQVALPAVPSETMVAVQSVNGVAIGDFGNEYMRVTGDTVKVVVRVWPEPISGGEVQLWFRHDDSLNPGALDEDYDGYPDNGDIANSRWDGIDNDWDGTLDEEQRDRYGNDVKWGEVNVWLLAYTTGGTVVTDQEPGSAAESPARDWFEVTLTWDVSMLADEHQYEFMPIVVDGSGYGVNFNYQPLPWKRSDAQFPQGPDVSDYKIIIDHQAPYTYTQVVKNTDDYGPTDQGLDSWTPLICSESQFAGPDSMIVRTNDGVNNNRLYDLQAKVVSIYGGLDYTADLDEGLGGVGEPFSPNAGGVIFQYSTDSVTWRNLGYDPDPDYLSTFVATNVFNPVAMMSLPIQRYQGNEMSYVGEMIPYTGRIINSDGIFTGQAVAYTQRIVVTTWSLDNFDILALPATNGAEYYFRAIAADLPDAYGSGRKNTTAVKNSSKRDELVVENRIGKADENFMRDINWKLGVPFEVMPTSNASHRDLFRNLYTGIINLEYITGPRSADGADNDGDGLVDENDENDGMDTSYQVYTIKSAAGSNGTIFPSGVVRMTCGEDQRFIITPDPCYRIAGLLVDNEPVEPVTEEYIFENVTSNHTIEARFVMTDYTIRAIAGPNGTITPSGDVAVKCGSSQTFTMTPDIGYYLSELLVDGTRVEPEDTYTFTDVTSDHIIEARFSTKGYTITAIAGVNGSISPPSAQVSHGGSATFIITPNPCYQIETVLVDNEPVDPGPEYTFQNVTSDRTIQAVFAVSEYIITATAGPNGNMLPSGEVRVRCGSDQKFTMIPATGYHLTELLVDGTQVRPEATYTFTNVTSDHTIEARFSIDTYGITSIAGENGSISPPSAQVSHGGSATFTITPDPCYQIETVLVDNEPVGVLPEYTFQNVTSNRTIEAQFVINEYTITATAGPNGTISPVRTRHAVSVLCGSDQEFIMTPAAGYHLSELLVDDTQVNPVSPYIFTNVISNHTIEARFSIDTYTITSIARENGSISPTSTQVNHGGSATFTITPDPCYRTATLLVDNRQVDTVPEYTFQNVTSNRTIEARFVIDSYTIRSTSEGSGGIAPFGDVNVPCGSSSTFTITPAIGYHIADVLVDDRSVGTEPTYTFTNVTSDHTIRARFELNKYIVTASAGDHGSISPAGDVQVSSAESLIFRMTPDPCYHVSDVLVDGRSVGAVGTHTFSNVTSDHSIEAQFAINTYTVRSSAEANGSISPSGSASVICGSDQSFTITPAEGYHVLDVLVDGRSVGVTTTYRFANVTSDHTIRARFGLTQYTISAGAGEHGRISPPGEVGASHGASQAFTITPDDCYRIADCLVNNQSVGPVTQYTFENVTSDQSIMATFEVATYMVTAAAGTGGSISPSGAVAVNCGESQTFAITPDPCYTIADVLVNNDSVGAVTEYTFENVRSNQTIRALFETISYTITASAESGGNISPSGEVTVDCGSSQTFTIAPANCYRVADVLVNNQSVGPVTEYTFENVTADQTISAMFEVADLTINASAGTGGSITPTGGVTVSCGSSQTFIITTDNCYDVADVLVNNQSVGPVTEYTFPDVTADQTIRATFELATYTINASAGAGGSISPYGIGTQHAVSVQCGSSQTFTITPDPCYHIVDVLADNESAGAVTSYTFDSVLSDHTIRAVFEINTYTITATAGANGRISPAGVTTVNCGSSRTYTITPSQGYIVSNLLVDGRSLGSMETYAFTNISSNHTISASFRVADDVPPTGSVTINDNAQYTNNRMVNLRLSASDNSGIVSQMQFSNDNVNYSNWETYATTSQWQLSAGDGRKTVYVRFSDGEGNQSTARSDSITLDTAPPTGRISINNGDEYTSSAAVSLTMSVTDSGSGLAQMRFSNNNASFSSPENYSSTTTWNLTSGDGLKTVYARFQDGAGNWTTATISDNIELDTEPPEGIISETEDVPVNAPIQISFSEEIDEGSIDIRVSGSISGSISGRTTYRNGELTFVPDRNFSDGEEVTVEVVARDLADNRISFSVGFSTAFGVWPGDTNNDSIVNILDLLPVGQYWGERGDRRSPADTSWEVQHATPWENNEQATYVDADGNGVVDERDLEVIDQNWGLTRPANAAPPVVAMSDLEKLQRLSPGKELSQYLDTTTSPGIEQLKTFLSMLLNPSEPKQIPVYSSLGQNYPNPFNPDTWIPYQLAKGSDVNIEIYNASGQLVRTIGMGYKGAGVYITKQKAAYWDGRSDFGESVSSGIYFYTIKAGSFTNTRKLIVVR